MPALYERSTTCKVTAVAASVPWPFRGALPEQVTRLRTSRWQLPAVLDSAAACNALAAKQMSHQRARGVAETGHHGRYERALPTDLGQHDSRPQSSKLAMPVKVPVTRSNSGAPSHGGCLILRTRAVGAAPWAARRGRGSRGTAARPRLAWPATGAVGEAVVAGREAARPDARRRATPAARQRRRRRRRTCRAGRRSRPSPRSSSGRRAVLGRPAGLESRDVTGIGVRSELAIQVLGGRG